MTATAAAATPTDVAATPATEAAPTCASRVEGALALVTPDDTEVAREALSAIVSSDASCAVARIELAAMLLRDETTASAAVEQLDAALELDPSDARARELLAVAYLETDALDSAAAVATALAAEHPERGTTEIVLGLVARARGELLVARTHFERAVAAEPDLFEAHMAVADLALEVRDYETAATEYTAARWLRPGARVKAPSIDPTGFSGSSARARRRAARRAPRRDRRARSRPPPARRG